MSHDIAVQDVESIPVLPVVPLPATITGTSGTVYRAVNLLTELTTRQKNAARDCIASVLPTVLMGLQAVQEALASDGQAPLDSETMQNLIRGIDLEAVFNALVYDDLDVRLLAILYPAEDKRWYDADDVEVRAADLLDLTYGEKFEAFKGFFAMNFAFSPSTSHGFMQTMLTPKPTTATT